MQPSNFLGNWGYLDVFRQRTPVTTKGFLGRIKTVAQSPQHLARFSFTEDYGGTPNHWRLEYYGESRTDEVAALARELAAEFDVKIFVVLDSA